MENNMDKLKELKASVYDLIRIQEQTTSNIQRLIAQINEIEAKQKDK